MSEIISSILAVVIIVILLCVAWIGAFREWKRRERHNELMVIYERFRKLMPDEMQEYRYYEDSFFLIAKGGKWGKKNAFEAAYTIGYLTGNGGEK